MYPEKDDFYYRFEERFRGSREEIKRRQSVYLPILRPLKALQLPPTVLDLGCGRGEWLELMTENGFAAQGVDLDGTMLRFCAEHGLIVHHADALDYLRSMQDGALSVVSGFHIAEHLPFETLKSLIREAHRALIPGGVLILETPNPENLVVGASTFYTDPTHRAPLPLHLLHYLGEITGFIRVKVVRLNGSPEESYSSAPDFPSMFRLLFGVGADYSIVAQKEAPVELLSMLPWFAEPEDESNSLAQRVQEFDSQTLALALAMQRTQQGQGVRLDAVAEHQQSTDERLAELSTLWAQAQDLQQQQWVRLDAVFQSHSWRATGPFRWASTLARQALRIPSRIGVLQGDLFKRIVRRVLGALVAHIRLHPRRRNFAVRALARWPRLSTFLRKLVIPPQSVTGSGPDALVAPQLKGDHSIDWGAYPPAVRRNYMLLMRAKAHKDRSQEDNRA